MAQQHMGFCYPAFNNN